MVAEDMHLVRGALVALLNVEDDIDVVAEVATGDEILPTAQRCTPDVAVIDVDLPGKDGIIAAAELHANLPSCQTLIVTSYGRPGTLRRALSAKVRGFIPKDAPATELAEAIRDVAAGHRVVDNALALAAWDTADCPLTAREFEVLRQAASGSDIAEIAAQLYLTPGTVRNYMAAIVNKLHARNRTDAVRIAIEADWL
jgi:two-component system, NarL family, response regulator DesR